MTQENGGAIGQIGVRSAMFWAGVVAKGGSSHLQLRDPPIKEERMYLRNEGEQFDRSTVRV